MSSFDDQVVIVTGAASGFGAAIGRTFAAKGAHVVLADLDVTRAESLAAELPSAVAVRVDVSSEADNVTMADTAMDAFGRLDVVVANAGIPHLAGSALEMSVETWDHIYAVNVRSVFLAAKHCVPKMTDGGSLIATASIGARRPRVGLACYNSSKGAVVTLTKALAAEFAPRVRVNAVNPVSAPTGFDRNATGHDALPPDFERKVTAGIPMGRRATPEDVANAVAFLASEEAAFLTGVCLDVDGGRSIN
jgi:3-oxoacyl-[acyl-carrier protein] reductase